MKNLVLIMVSTIMTFSLSSCVSFRKSMIKDDWLEVKKENVHMIDGDYDYNGYEYVRNDNVKSDTAGNVGDILDVQSSLINNCDRVRIKSVPLVKDKMYEIQFAFLKGNEVKYLFKYDAELKKGMLLLKNYTSKCHGVPYLLGGCQVSQSRMGLTRDKNLLIQNYKDNSGALLLFFWSGYTINYAEKYKRINR
ncbi:hypothetical protein [Chryseobacterium artocarpi]|nr:hypothetical protein [Chryseobacterium artocarpi]